MRGMALRHSSMPFLRKETSTLALRLSSPVIGHSNPRLISVGGSITISPGVTARFLAGAASTFVLNRLNRSPINSIDHCVVLIAPRSFISSLPYEPRQPAQDILRHRNDSK